MTYKVANTVGLALASVIASAGPLLACDQYNAAVAAVQSDNPSEAAALYETILVSPECDDPLREWVADYLARSSFAYAVEKATTPEDKRDALLRALSYEKHWRSYAELGRIDWAAKNYGPAATNFQLAINELVDGDPGHVAEESEIAEVYQLATAAMALADTPVEMPTTRSGEIGGIFKTKIRGFSVEEVSLPITFKYNSTEFDASGQTYADALAEHLKLLAPASVVLAGHTDPRGGEEYNLDLSEARAVKLSEFLHSHGFNGEIQVKGYGESRLPVAPEGIAPDSEEYFRIARRVTFEAE